MSVREESVLRPKKASDRNPDNWPQFILKHTKVTSIKTGRNISLLSAHPGNPLKVSGRLQAVDDDLLHLVRDQSYRDKTIELDHVTTYSFAEYNDGTFGFWAAGKAGWFEIQSPVASYKTIHAKMNEAASIFYLLADRLRRAGKRTRNLNTSELNRYVKKVFQAFFVQRKDPAYPADVDEACAIFHEHRDFLVTSMLEGQEELDWRQTPMLKYFQSKFPDECAAIKARILSPVAAAPVELEVTAKDSRDSSRKRKSQSPQGSSHEKKKQKRKAAQQAESRIQLLPKGLIPKTPQQKEPSRIPSSDEDDISDMNLLGRKQKSILQPSGGKYSNKAFSRHQGLSDMEPAEGSEDDENDDDDEQANSETSPIATLHNARDLEKSTILPMKGSSLDESPRPRVLPRKYLELKMFDYNLPAIEPQGPGDLWTCTFEGCFDRVHEASTQEGKRRIDQHFKTHASKAQEKIDLALDESRPYLPVNNLLRRLQAFAPPPPPSTGPDPGSLGRNFSAPIRRR